MATLLMMKRQTTKRVETPFDRSRTARFGVGDRDVPIVIPPPSMGGK